MKELQTEAQRRGAIAWAIALISDTGLPPDQYELQLLEEYAQGTLALSQVMGLLDGRIHHLLYRSQATHPLQADELTALVEQSRVWNEAHGITGLLCYSTSGHFVQVLEGSEAAVHSLFARIQRDKRHHNVQALSDRATAKRWFADWRMALVSTGPHEFHWLLGYLEAKGHNLVRPQIPIMDPTMLKLLEEFSKV